MSTETPPRLWTIAETARYLGVSEATVRRRVAAGELRAVRLSDTQRAPVRISETDLAAWLERTR